MKNNKLLLTISIVTLVAILIVGSTFAVWSWTSDRGNDTNVTFTTEKGFSCSVDGGGNITEANIKLVPTSCDNREYVIKREITTNVINNRDIPIYMDLWLDIKKLSQGLSDSHNFRYTITTSSTSCSEGNIISYGTFNTKEVNDKIDLILNDKYASTGTKTYYLYIWLDYNGIDRTSQNEEFTLELGGACTDEESNSTTIYEPNRPYLYDTGLIPVVLSDSGDTVTTIEEDNPNWYNYDQKKWANAILVKENGTKKRDYYKGFPGTVVNQEDILAYYVWIPRYSYQVWAYSGSDPAGSPHEIPIKFIPTTVIDEASVIGDYYTHPAFWWDDDSDGIREEGEELSGIWVGKFETHHTSYQTNSASSLECTSTSCDSTKYNGLRILPNVRPLTSNKVSSFFFASRAMETSGNDFGINPNTTDSHMMKNSEWGAVAYLSHSKYGINDEIRINNTYNIVYNGSTRTFLTGCGAGTPNEASEAACDIQYGTVTTYPQSTTGNVTGIFDMSGGTNEYVMGTYNNSNSYSNTSSGFTSSNPLPDAKYYDNYANPPFDGTNSTNFTKCTLEYCGGHALNETKNWHSDYPYFVTSSNPWFSRGGISTYGSNAGSFLANYGYGGANFGDSARLVLLAE